jgi:hypothetical protein
VNDAIAESIAVDLEQTINCRCTKDFLNHRGNHTYVRNVGRIARPALLCRIVAMSPAINDLVERKFSGEVSLLEK